MSDEETRSPIPWGLVEHVNRTKTGRTTMQISLSIEARARLAQAALDLGCSKLALIRTAISQFLLAHEENRRSGQERAYAATSEVPPPVPGLVPAEPVEAPVSELVPEPAPISQVPGTCDIPVKAPRRARKEKA